MKKRTGVVICFYNDEGKILLQERGDYSKMGEKWAFFGGGIEEGETHFEAFLREAKEELDLDMTQFDFQYIGKRVRYYSEADYEATRYFYLVKTQMQREDFNVLEGSGCEYFTLDEAKNLHFAFEMDDEIEMLKRNIFPEKYLETAIGFVVEYFSGIEAKKPMILHSLGVGFSLLERKYNVDVVIAGFLHDIVEDTDISKEFIEKHFGKYTLELIIANTKDAFIEKEFRNTELIERCAYHTEDALRVKMMDIKNNFEYYVVKNQIQEIKRCQYLSELLLQYKKDEYQDEIFQEAHKIISHQI